MKISASIVALALVATSCHAFVTPNQSRVFSRPADAGLKGLLQDDSDLEATLERQLTYKPGEAKGNLAKRYGSLAGKKIKTVGEAFAEFTELLGSPMNALYKNSMTDIVGTTHLIVVTARFKRDPIWSLGLLSSLDLLLKNYPEQDIAKRAVTALINCCGMDEAEVRAEAKAVSDWAQGKSKEDIEAALRGEGSGPVAEVGNAIKEDEFWMYSKYFGLGLVKLMELVGVEQSKDVCYSTMEDWMGKALNKPTYTATSDSDQFFGVKGKLDMMETLMKEIEIREKKRMAERLEEKAEMAIKAAERDAKWESEKSSESSTE